MRSPRGPAEKASARSGGARTGRTDPLVLLLAARREALWLTRNPLVLAGLAVSAWLIWLNNRTISFGPLPYGLSQPPFWWAADVSIAACLLAAAGGVLIASQLAAGRARRDGMEQLYLSYPAPASVRAGAQLLGVTGPAVLAAVLTGAAVAWLDSEDALGTPRPWVLGGGLLLIGLGGSLGLALGSWLRHPLSGILAVLVLGPIEIDLVLSYSNPIHLPGGVTWLFPWSAPGNVLNSLPGLTVPYPPPAHLWQLAGLIGLAVVASLWRVLARRRMALVLALAALAVTCWSAWTEAQPLSPAVLAAMAREVTEPAGSEQCQPAHGVRYCYYPAFRPLARQWAVPVDGVLSRLPRAPRAPLTVRQVWDLSFFMPPLLAPADLTSNGPGPPTALSAAVGRFQEALPAEPGLVPGSGTPPVYTDATWGTGSILGSLQFALAVSTAEWATGLPTTGRSVTWNYATPGGGSEGGTDVVGCVPVGQARQSIALWLAAGSTPGARSAFAQAGIVAHTQVGRKWLTTVAEPGSGPLVGLTATEQGTDLAARMLRLPDRKVEAVLGARWRFWLSPRATAADLAAALRLRLPPQPPARPATRDPVTYSNFTPPARVCR
jgi:hypothetical protein